MPIQLESLVLPMKTEDNDFKAGLSRVTQLASAAVEAIQDVVNVTTEYSEQVRDQALASGQGAEAASRFLQVLDDYQLSAEDAATATKALTKQGLAPTIETIANLSGQYLKLNSAQDRNAFLQKNLGRASKEWLNIMQQGPEAIMAANAAVSQSLILTDANVQAAEEYRLALDNWNDSVMGLKVSIGNNLLPFLTRLIEEKERLTGGSIELQEEIAREVEQGTFVSRGLAQQAVDMREYTDGLDSAGLSYRAYAQAVGEGSTQIQTSAEDAKAVSTSITQFLGVLGNIGGALSTYNTGVAEVNANFQNSGFVADLYRQRLEELRTSYTNGEITTKQYGDAVSGLKTSYADGSFAANEHGKAINDLAADYQAAQNQIVLSIVAMKLASDGWTDAELNAYLQVGQRLGAFTQQQVDASKDAVEAADNIVKGYDPLTAAVDAAGGAADKASGPIDNFGDNVYHTGERAVDASDQLKAMGDGQSHLASRINDESTPAVAGLKAAINGLRDKVVNVDVYIKTHGGMPGTTGLGSSGLGGGVSVCFVAGTLITMSDGTRKRIEDIQAGDVVRSYDVEAREFVAGKVTQTFRHVTDNYLNIDGLLVTPEHPLWIIGREDWVKAGEVKRGDILLRDYGGMKSVVHIVSVFVGVEVYNLEVDTHHNYFAGGVLVHNKDIDNGSGNDTKPKKDELSSWGDKSMMGSTSGMSSGPQSVVVSNWLDFPVAMLAQEIVKAQNNA